MGCRHIRSGWISRTACAGWRGLAIAHCRSGNAPAAVGPRRHQPLHARVAAGGGWWSQGISLVSLATLRRWRRMASNSRALRTAQVRHSAKLKKPVRTKHGTTIKPTRRRVQPTCSLSGLCSALASVRLCCGAVALAAANARSVQTLGRAAAPLMVYRLRADSPGAQVQWRPACSGSQTGHSDGVPAARPPRAGTRSRRREQRGHKHAS
jgi:hypothetical protein